MFTGNDIVDFLTDAGITHVVWLPDSTLGQWEEELRACESIRLITVCREGEAWAVAGGLYLGGANPLVMIQCTGLFESGDSLRTILHDYKIPLFAIIGYRSYLNQDTLPGDTALIYTEPVAKAWDLDFRLIDSPEKRGLLREHYETCRETRKSGAILLAEGKA